MNSLSPIISECNDSGNESINSADEALFDMLGLSPNQVQILAEVEPEQSEKGDFYEERQSDHPKKSVPITSTATAMIPLHLPQNVSRHFHPPNECLAFVIPQLLSPKECQQLIQLGSTAPTADSNKHGFNYITHAIHQAPDGSTYQVQLQNPNHHKLSVFSHSEWIDLIWHRLEQFLRCHNSGKDLGNNISSVSVEKFLQRERVPAPTRINPRLRVLRYDAADNDDFSAHFDATTRIDGEISLLTVLIYLNQGGGEDFNGGETVFMDSHPHASNRGTNVLPLTKVTPQIGSAVIFEHDLYHSGYALEWGTKFVLRTDIMFQISEAQWSARAQAREIKNVESTTSIGSGNIISEGTHKNIPATIQELAHKLGWTMPEIESLNALGLGESSMESFCSPGRFALFLMLQDSVCSNPAKIRSLIDEAMAIRSNRSDRQ